MADTFARDRFACQKSVRATTERAGCTDFRDRRGATFKACSACHDGARRDLTGSSLSQKP